MNREINSLIISNSVSRPRAYAFDLVTKKGKNKSHVYIKSIVIGILGTLGMIFIFGLHLMVRNQKSSFLRKVVEKDSGGDSLYQVRIYL